MHETGRLAGFGPDPEPMGLPEVKCLRGVRPDRVTRTEETFFGPWPHRTRGRRGDLPSWLEGVATPGPKAATSIIFSGHLRPYWLFFAWGAAFLGELGQNRAQQGAEATLASCDVQQERPGVRFSAASSFPTWRARPGSRGNPISNAWPMRDGTERVFDAARPAVFVRSSTLLGFQSGDCAAALFRPPQGHATVAVFRPTFLWENNQTRCGRP